MRNITTYLILLLALAVSCQREDFVHSDVQLSLQFEVSDMNIVQTKHSLILARTDSYLFTNYTFGFNPLA